MLLLGKELGWTGFLFGYQGYFGHMDLKQPCQPFENSIHPSFFSKNIYQLKVLRNQKLTHYNSLVSASETHILM